MRLDREACLYLGDELVSAVGVFGDSRCAGGLARSSVTALNGGLRSVLSLHRRCASLTSILDPQPPEENPDKFN